jgi:hypothetical protein
MTLTAAQKQIDELEAYKGKWAILYIHPLFQEIGKFRFDTEQIAWEHIARVKAAFWCEGEHGVNRPEEFTIIIPMPVGAP